MVGADLSAPDTGVSFGWGQLVVPVRPPAGPYAVELQLDLWLDRMPRDGGGQGKTVPMMPP